MSIAPPSPLPLLPVKVHPVMVTVPAFSSPPPPKRLAMLYPSAMVSPDKATYSPAGTVSTAPSHEAVEQPVPEEVQQGERLEPQVVPRLGPLLRPV